MIKSIIEIILVFIFIKFLFISGVGYIAGVDNPFGAVLSGSMEHDGNFTKWWSIHSNQYKTWNINESEFKNFPFTNGLDKGDVVFFVAPNNIEVGDIIIFEYSNNRLLLHRVVSIDPLNTQGDANFEQLPNEESNIASERIIGKIVFKLPYLGYVRCWIEDIRKWIK
jgi:hypothetical protein